MKNIFLVVAFLIVGSSCNYLSNHSKPQLSLSENAPYYLEISNFKWNYGLTEINKFNGDFETLDHNVFDLLKGKQGICTVKLEQSQTDKYGKSSSIYANIGTIDLTELNKFESWEYWYKDGGIQRLLYKLYFSNTDSTKIETAPPVSQSLGQAITGEQNTTIKPKTYTFTITDLYPLESDRNNLDLTQFTRSGIILDANYANGIMKVRDSDGEEHIVQFYPLDASSAVQSDLKLAITRGNKIKAVYARAGANTEDLVSAEITEP
ncbi:hypothetical protein KXQ82_10370 [Mucilaginibacter sp. HMF5004]|uniref:hypothetical protein n=1 Tax=Mucilaginibacter rivuli TaxID=2857527 RepID=UPI001C5EB953|nr:hypothetical protein [Mucilaginibacter rivuli]MBW4890123.1 hypothetical protein [Mucilaginibacter rivuli]